MSTYSADDHEGWEELAIGHTLSALEPDDERQFVAHLRTCERCAQVLADMSAVMGDLASAAEPIEPPASLRRSIIEAVERDRPLASESTGAEEKLAVPPASVSRLEVRRESRTTRHRTAKPSWLVAAACLIVAIGFGVWNVGLRNDRSDTRAQLAQVENALGCLGTPDCRTIPMTYGSSTRAVALVQKRQVWVIASGLPNNDTKSSVYVLWQQVGGSMRPVGTFDVHGKAASVDIGQLPTPLSDTTLLAISHERGRTVPARPSTPVAAGTV